MGGRPGAVGCSGLCFGRARPGKGWREEAEAGSGSWRGEARWGPVGPPQPSGGRSEVERGMALTGSNMSPARSSDCEHCWGHPGEAGGRERGSLPFSAGGSQPVSDPPHSVSGLLCRVGCCSKHFYA